jgi:hypothetical protein
MPTSITPNSGTRIDDRRLRKPASCFASNLKPQTGEFIRRIPQFRPAEDIEMDIFQLPPKLQVLRQPPRCTQFGLTYKETQT